MLTLSTQPKADKDRCFHFNASGMITDTHDNNICAEKVNCNRKFFNRCTFSWTIAFKNHLFTLLGNGVSYCWRLVILDFYLIILLKYLTVICDLLEMLWKAYWTCIKPHPIALKQELSIYLYIIYTFKLADSI